MRSWRRELRDLRDPGANFRQTWRRQERAVADSIAALPRAGGSRVQIWSTHERLEFFTAIAADPDLGEVIPGSGGCRKVRWSRPGMGKRGGARIVCFARLDVGELCMLFVYRKAAKDNIPSHLLKQIRKELEDGWS